MNVNDSDFLYVENIPINATSITTNIVSGCFLDLNKNILSIIPYSGSPREVAVPSGAKYASGNIWKPNTDGGKKAYLLELPIPTSTLPLNTNLIQSSQILNGYWDMGSNSFVTSSLYHGTDFIKVTPDIKITHSGGYTICCWNGNKQPIETMNNGDFVPKYCDYITISIPIDNVAEFTVKRTL